MAGRLRILIVDDHEVVREGVKRVLEGEDRFEVCGEAADGPAAIQEADRLKPDLVVMDLRIPGLDGLQATRRILATHPQIRVLVFTIEETEQMAQEALRAGAKGFLSKADAGADLIGALQSLALGQTYLSPRFRERAGGNPSSSRAVS